MTIYWSSAVKLAGDYGFSGNVDEKTSVLITSKFEENYKVKVSSLKHSEFCITPACLRRSVCKKTSGIYTSLSGTVQTSHAVNK